MPSLHSRLCLSAVCIALALSASAPAHAAVFTVGTGPTCTHRLIQDAIDAAAANGADTNDTVRITRDPLSVGQALNISGQRLTLRGGYDDCTSTTLPVGAPTLIDGNGNGGVPVFRIANPGAVRRTVIIENLDIVRGGVPSISTDGGGVHASGNMQLELNGIRIHENRAARGGGIYARGDAANRNVEITLSSYGLTPRISKVEDNQADLGGGIYVDADAQLRIVAAQISNNFATDGGGVLFAADSSGQFFGSATADPPGIFGNSASRDGGGLQISGRTNIFYQQFVADAVFIIQDNSAGRDGGGIHASGAGASLLMGGALRGNRAGTQSTGRGGGIFVAAGAIMTFRGADPFDATAFGCPSTTDCALISSNIAGSPTLPGQGGGVFVAAGGRANVRIAAMRNNGASQGGALMASGAGAILIIESALVTGNTSDDAVLAATDTAELTIRGSTVSGNPATASMLTRSNSAITVTSSILYEPFRPALVTTGGMSGTISTRCVFAHENFDPTGDVRLGDPGFNNAAVGDYTLRLDSPAVDACIEVDAFPRDSRNQPRGVDLLEVIDVDGPFDAGANERQRLDPLFANSFEN